MDSTYIEIASQIKKIEKKNRSKYQRDRVIGISMHADIP